MVKALAFAASVALVSGAVADQEWEDFKAKYNKKYLSDDDETQRYEIFKASKDRVAKLNALQGDMGEAFGINWSSDRMDNEKHAKGLRKPEGFVATAPVYEKKYARRAPSSINWRTTEAITAIKNQGQCGSCWAFSATEAIESQMILSTGGKFAVELSPQQITSCTPDSGEYGSLGCNGGFTEGAYEYVMNVTGLANSFYIPYEQSLTESTATAACMTSKVAAIDGPNQQLTGGFAQVTGYTYATPACTSGACANQDLDQLSAALEETPVSVCVNAGAWNDYSGGVMSSAACGSMAADEQDHCVMATGFNTTAATPYWIVRNSWADSWGEEGYIYLEMSENTCGLADDATIPTVVYDGSAEAEAGRARMFAAATQGSPRVPNGFDCSSGLCQAGCECGNAYCSAEIDACSADSVCAAGQGCYAQCACDDTDCVIACATEYPSAENGPYFDCMTANCSGKKFV